MRHQRFFFVAVILAILAVLAVLAVILFVEGDQSTDKNGGTDTDDTSAPALVVTHAVAGGAGLTSAA